MVVVIVLHCRVLVGVAKEMDSTNGSGTIGAEPQTSANN